MSVHVINVMSWPVASILQSTQKDSYSSVLLKEKLETDSRERLQSAK